MPSFLLAKILRTRRGRRIGGRLLGALRWHLRRHEEDVLRRFSPDGRVISGPFRGMWYGVGKPEGSVAGPKLAGAYEAELHAVLEECFGRTWGDAVDIGCDDGYYAVGFARRLPPPTRVFALDLNPSALRQCAILSEKNGVSDRLVIAEGCEPAQLRALPVRGPCLILSDCEGAEDELIRPEYLPPVTCDLLIEAHDFPGKPPMAAELVRRFAATHEATVIRGQPRHASDHPAMLGMRPAEQDIVLEESRPYAMEWVFLRARQEAA